MNVQKTSFPALWVKILNTWQHTKSEQRKLGCNWQCTQFWGRHTQQQKNVTKKIKLSITWPVIHSVSVGLPPHTAFSISKTTSVRNEPDQCKNTDSLPSKVFTHVLVHLVAVYQTCLGPKKETKTNKKSLILKSGEKGAALSPPPPSSPDVKQPALLLVTEGMSSFSLSNVETKECLQRESLHGEGLQFFEEPSYYAATLLSFLYS